MHMIKYNTLRQEIQEIIVFFLHVQLYAISLCWEIQLLQTAIRYIYEISLDAIWNDPDGSILKRSLESVYMLFLLVIGNYAICVQYTLKSADP